MKKIIVVGVLPSSLSNFRGELIQSFSRTNKVVCIASRATKNEITSIETFGVRYLNYPISRNGLNPAQDLKTFLALIRIFKTEKPDIILAYTIKPVIWAGLAARFTNVSNFYGLITGLGFAFQTGGVKRNLLTKIVKFLYRQALKKSSGVIFQNQDNRDVFINNSIADESNTFLVNGSGVDLSHFEVKELPAQPNFLLIARLLGEKGIREYIQAAKLVKAKYSNTIFDLVGPEDPSPDGLPIKEVLAWHEDGIINYHGGADDVRPYIESCSIFVLPSYHEGMPRTVLEAMATGRPILTTNVPGCKETVIDGENGWLVEKANAEQLAEKMIWFIENPQEWQRMAEKSREIAIEKFDVHKVNAEIMNIMGLVK